MRGCLDRDALVTLGAALDWEIEERLRHLAECESCRAELKRLATVHSVLGEELQPAPGFADRVLHALRVEPGARPARSRLPRLAGVLNPVLAALTSFFAVAFVATGQGVPELGPPALFVSLLVAVVTVWWNRARRLGRLV
jgi:predicted anti-sigma-YlaC factor YlaD